MMLEVKLRRMILNIMTLITKELTIRQRAMTLNIEGKQSSIMTVNIGC
jgi:hypothetical protein